MRRPLLTPAQRTALLSLCTAAYGFAIGIATFPHWIRAAPPDQLPGFLKSHDLDAHISFRFFAAFAAITIVTTFALRPIVNLLTNAHTRAWARNGAALAMLVAVWYATVSRVVMWTLIPTAVAIVVCRHRLPPRSAPSDHRVACIRRAHDRPYPNGIVDRDVG